MRFMVGNERSQMRFSDVYSLDLPECLWSASQCLTTRVCGPWYGSPSVAEEQLFLPMDSWAGMSIEEVNIYTWRDPRCHNIYNWLAVKNCFLWPFCVLEHNLNYLWAFWWTLLWCTIYLLANEHCMNVEWNGIHKICKKHEYSRDKNDTVYTVILNQVQIPRC